jgi:MFS family permease
MQSFNDSFGLDPKSPGHASLEGNIVSVLQAGCFFGAASSFYLSDKLGRKRALLLADLIFIIGSIVQTTCAMGQGHDLAQLYVGRVIGGFGVGLVSAVVPTYIGENANKEIRGVSRRHYHHIRNPGIDANTSQSDASAACNCSSKSTFLKLE